MLQAATMGSSKTHRVVCRNVQSATYNRLNCLITVKDGNLFAIFGYGGLKVKLSMGDGKLMSVYIFQKISFLEN